MQQSPRFGDCMKAVESMPICRENSLKKSPFRVGRALRRRPAGRIRGTRSCRDRMGGEAPSGPERFSFRRRTLPRLCEDSRAEWKVSNSESDRTDSPPFGRECECGTIPILLVERFPIPQKFGQSHVRVFCSISIQIYCSCGFFL